MHRELPVSGTIAEQLKQLRHQAGYSQAHLAYLLGICRSTYAYYECGKTLPDIYCLKHLANIFGVTLDSFFYLSSNFSRNPPHSNA